jgi:hypothetical protein
MESLKLKVTSKVLAQVLKFENQKQIAIEDSKTGLLAASLHAANKTNCIHINIAGAWVLAFCDTHATWRSHNPGKEKEFDALFEFLSKFPDQEFEFVCALAK